MTNKRGADGLTVGGRGEGARIVNLIRWEGGLTRWRETGRATGATESEEEGEKGVDSVCLARRCVRKVRLGEEEDGASPEARRPSFDHRAKCGTRHQITPEFLRRARVPVAEAKTSSSNVKGEVTGGGGVACGSIGTGELRRAIGHDDDDTRCTAHGSQEFRPLVEGETCPDVSDDRRLLGRSTGGGDGVEA
jgi:hypothetical protein